MSEKYYVGLDVSGFADNGEYRPISRVTLLLDDENALTAGDDTGMEIKASCPYATQEMVESLLARFRGSRYRAYSAKAANVDPAAELGDGITVGGVYASISALHDNGDGFADVSAPGEVELEEEYPFESPTKREFDQKIATTRALITKTAQEIGLRVEGLDSKYAELSVTVDGVTIRDETGATRIKGSSIDTTTIQANSITADKVNLTGSISWGDLAADTQQVISAASNNAATANNKVSAWSYAGSTYIDGSKIMAGTVMASKLLGGTVGLLASDQTVVGSLDIAYTTTGIGLGINTTYGGIQIQSGGNVFLRAAAGQVLTVGGGYFSFGGGPILLPTSCYGTSLPSTGTYGQLFFLLDS